MFTKSFNTWLEDNYHAWSGRFSSKDEIGNFVLKHTSRGTSIGKVLNRLKLDWAMPGMKTNPDKEIMEGVLAFNATEYVAKVEFTSDYTAISEAYKNVKSCMTDQYQELTEFLTDELIIEQGIQLATYTHENKVVGRCIVNIRNKGMLPIYSSIGGQEFATALQELGYLPAKYTKGVFSGIKLPWTTCGVYFDETGSSHTMYRIVDEEWWFISELNVLVVGDTALSPTNQGHISLLDNKDFIRNIQELSEEAGFTIDPRKLELLDHEVAAWIPLLTHEIHENCEE